MSTAEKLPHFVVDKKGLAEMLARKSKAFVVTELVSNSWDEDSTQVDVSLEWLGGGKAKIVVEDDNPEGFANLAHAYTLYARSMKRTNAEQRGRFNLGEKLVVAICDSASVQTTKGTIVFDASGRSMLSAKRKAGSVFTGILPMTRAEYDEAVAVVAMLLPPAHITTTFNHNEMPTRGPLVKFDATLRTEIADDEGRLKPTTRKTKVEVYEPLAGEVATLYEMGIPVVETGDRYHVNVCVAPDTRILTDDLRYVPASELGVGSKLVGFDERREGHRRRFQPTEVLHVESIWRQTYRLTFDDGTVIVCSADHQWLTTAGKRHEWLSTEQMLVPNGDKPGSSVVRLLDVWDTDDSRDGGYLAAAFDGEGWLIQKEVKLGVTNRLGFSQNGGVMLDSVLGRLDAAGFAWRQQNVPEGAQAGAATRTAPHSQITLASREHMLRFLGQYRPERLLSKLDLALLGAIPMQRRARLVGKEFLGERQVLAIETTTHTFIAEGLASHNCQKVPLNTDRDNVTPAYLRDVRTLVLNNVHSLLTDADMREDWVTEAISDENVTADAVDAAVTGRYGEKRVIMDPTDPEANRLAMAGGYTVIPGGALPKEAWRQVRTNSVVLPAGRVTPSPNPNEGAENLKVMPPEQWPDPVVRVAAFARLFAERLMGAEIEVRVVNSGTWPFDATYGPRAGATGGLLTLNYGRLGYKWFDGPLLPIVDLCIHEFGHHYCSDHLDHRYLRALSRLGAQAIDLALREPTVFELRDAAVTA